MAFQDLSTNSQDYLKVIWDLQEWSGEAVQPSALAHKTGMKLSTVSGAIARLASSGLVEHTPYGAITLTQQGEKYALIMVRRHRLLEAFLVETLGYKWDEVHAEADSLEHAVSDGMITRIDETLKHPGIDPHGDPIPSANGHIAKSPSLTLAKAPENSRVVVERVSDDDSDLLRYLASEKIGIGTTLRIGQKTPYSNSVSITVEQKNASSVQPSHTVTSRNTVTSGHTLALGYAAAENIRIQVKK